MIILPAIDLKDGTCVRLVRGEYDTAYKVAESPVETAQSFGKAGARWLHMVDLDGAKDGKLINRDVIVDVCRHCELQVEVGGGIRDMQAVEFYLSHGVNRVILGSAALQNPSFVKEAVERFDERIVVGIDARDGMVASEGWLTTSTVHYIDLAKQMEKIGVKNIIFTDIATDGTLAGPNLVQLDALDIAVSCNVIASGGVATLKDIVNLRDLGVYGAICGKSIYSGALNLEHALIVARGAGKKQ